MKEKTKKGLIYSGLIIGIILIIFVGIVCGYVAYLSAHYYRIKDYTDIKVYNNQTSKVLLGEDYSISTYNIGFGAYSQDFDFFMDSGKMLDGQKVSGSHSTAFSKEIVDTNTTGAINLIKSIDTDFAFFQEVDTDSTRSYNVNQYEQIYKSFNTIAAEEITGDYSYSFANNMHSSYLCYPFNDPIGTINSGITTLSKYNITSSTRRSFPIDQSFLNKFFDLDRCFEVNILPIGNSTKSLVLINLHLSAYDEGGKIRSKQLDTLFGFMKMQYNAGNYVIAGGDWNHDIADSLNTFKTQQEIPEWVYQIKEEDIPKGFSFASAKNAPTCRSTDMKYTTGSNYSVVIDGFIVSDNVVVNNVTNIGTDIDDEGNSFLVDGKTIEDYRNFLYSDHNPVYMSFTLVDKNPPTVSDSNFVHEFYERSGILELTFDLNKLNIMDESTPADEIMDNILTDTTYALYNLDDKNPILLTPANIDTSNHKITYSIENSGQYKFEISFKDRYDNAFEKTYEFIVLPDPDYIDTNI